MPIPPPALANIKRGLTILGGDTYVLHYRIVRVDGPKGTTLPIFGETVTKAGKAVFNEAWKAEVANTDKARWIVATGAIVRDADGWTIHPASAENRVVDPTSVKLWLKDLRAWLAKNSQPIGNVDPILTRGVITAPRDVRRLVTAGVELEDADLAEAGLDTSMHVSEQAQHPGVAPLVARFRGDAFREVLRVAAAAATDEARRDARASLATTAATLSELEHDAALLHAEMRNARLGTKRYADSIRAIDELLARTRGVAEAVDEAARGLVPAVGRAVAMRGLKDGVVVPDGDGVPTKTTRRAKGYLETAEALLPRVERLRDTVGTGAVALGLGRVLASPSTAEAAAFKRAQTIQKTARDLLEALGEVRTNLAGGPQMTAASPDTRAALKSAETLVEKAEEELKAILVAIEAGKLRGEMDDGGAGKRAEARKALVQASAKDAEVVKRFAQMPGARKQLDQMVAEIGEKAKDAETRAFVAHAIEARFNIGKVTGGSDGRGLSAKALPRLYALLKRVPEGHTVGNNIAEINRTKRATGYHGDFSAGTGVINISVGKTGRNHVQSPLGGQAVHAFDHTTLHEVGHAVDARRTIMDNANGTGRYGGWRKLDQGMLLDELIGTSKGFYTTFEADPYRYPRGFLRACARELLADHKLTATSDNLKTAWASHAEGRPITEVNFDALMKSPAAAWITDGLQSSKLYKKGDAAAETHAVGDLVVVDTNGGWWAYDKNDRRNKVSDYQYASPSEWFAELYAAYFMKVLPTSNPHYAWIDEEVGQR